MALLFGYCFPLEQLRQYAFVGPLPGAAEKRRRGLKDEVEAPET